MTTLTDRPVPAETPNYRLFGVEVVAKQVICPTFARITFGGPDLAAFGAGGADQRFKVLLPRPGLDAAAIATGGGENWYSWWRDLPDHLRPVMRTYTVRAHRPERGELDVDFVLHGVDGGGPCGPAARWAAETRPGDRVVLVGPGNPGTGRMWGVEFAPPAQTRTLLLAGDETAVPAVGSILQNLPAGMRTRVLLEVPEADDRAVLDLPDDPGLDVEWLPRRTSAGSAEHGSLLCARVKEIAAPLAATFAAPAPVRTDDDLAVEDVLWDVPENAVPAGPQAMYAWLAGEACVVKDLRRHLVREVGVPRSSVAFMGYWRRGRCEN